MVSGVKLASHADSSSGMLTDVIMCTYELIDKCTKEIEKKDKQMRDQALALIIKEAKKSVFDGWTDWRYNLLKSGICLCDEKSAKKLEKVLDTLLEISREDYFPEYTKKEDLIVRYLLHRHLYGKKNTQKELYQNISLNELRIIAIKDAMEDKNYDEAEKLCLEKANEEETWHYRSSNPEDCAQAKDRREYKKITKNIAQLIKWKGNDTAKSLIEELMQRYPRKPALLDELEKVEKKL